MQFSCRSLTRIKVIKRSIAPLLLYCHVYAQNCSTALSSGGRGVNRCRMQYATFPISHCMHRLPCSPPPPSLSRPISRIHHHSSAATLYRAIISLLYFHTLGGSTLYCTVNAVCKLELDPCCTSRMYCVCQNHTALAQAMYFVLAVCDCISRPINISLENRTGMYGHPILHEISAGTV